MLFHPKTMSQAFSSTSHSPKKILVRLMQLGLHESLDVGALLVDVYSTWLLLAVLFFSAKLGEDAEELGFHRLRSLLPAQGHPNQAPVRFHGNSI